MRADDSDSLAWRSGPRYVMHWPATVDGEGRLGARLAEWLESLR